MRIRPSELTNPKAVRVHEKAREVTETIDKIVDYVRNADQGPEDRNPKPGDVALSNALVERRATFSDVPMDVASSETHVKQGVLVSDNFSATVSLPGMWGILPIGLDAEVSRREEGGKVLYDKKYTDSVSGAKRFKVSVDTATGEIDYREYFDRWGLIRKPV